MKRLVCGLLLAGVLICSEQPVAAITWPTASTSIREDFGPTHNENRAGGRFFVEGIDINPDANSGSDDPVVAAEEGQVILADPDAGVVVIRQSASDRTERYKHLKRVDAIFPAVWSEGMQVGLMGNKGTEDGTTSVQLGFELRVSDQTRHPLKAYLPYIDPGTPTIGEIQFKGFYGDAPTAGTLKWEKACITEIRVPVDTKAEKDLNSVSISAISLAREKDVEQGSSLVNYDTHVNVVPAYIAPAGLGDDVFNFVDWSTAKTHEDWYKLVVVADDAGSRAAVTKEITFHHDCTEPYYYGSSCPRVGDFHLISYRIEHASEDLEPQMLLVA